MELPISDAEWRVINVLWDRAPATADDVIDALAEPASWSPRTIKTLLHRLVRKGALAYEKSGNRYLYTPQVAREDCIRQASQSFLARVFRGKTAPMLEHFVRDGGLTRDEIEHLRRLLDEESRRDG